MTHVPDPAPGTPATRATHTPRTPRYSRRRSLNSGLLHGQGGSRPEHATHAQHTSKRQSPGHRGDPKGTSRTRCRPHSSGQAGMTSARYRSTVPVVNVRSLQCFFLKWGCLMTDLLQPFCAGRRAENPRNPKLLGCRGASGVTADSGIVRECYAWLGDAQAHTLTIARPTLTPENAGDQLLRFSLAHRTCAPATRAPPANCAISNDTKATNPGARCHLSPYGSYALGSAYHDCQVYGRPERSSGFSLYCVYARIRPSDVARMPVLKLVHALPVANLRLDPPPPLASLHWMLARDRSR